MSDNNFPPPEDPRVIRRPQVIVSPVQHERARRPLYAPPPPQYNNYAPRPMFHSTMPYPPLIPMQERMRDEPHPVLPLRPMPEMPEVYPPYEMMHRNAAQSPYNVPLFHMHPLHYGMPTYMPHAMTPIMMHGGPPLHAYYSFQSGSRNWDTPPNDSPLNLVREVETDSSSEISSAEDMSQNLPVQFNSDRNVMGTVKESMDFGELGKLLEMTVDWARSNLQSVHTTSEERRMLLLNNWRELLVLTLAQQRYVFDEDAVIRRFLGIIPNLEEDLTRLTKFITRINQQKTSDSEYDCLKMIMLYRPEPPHLLPSVFRDKLQDRAMLALYKYSKRFEYPVRVARLLLTMPTVSALSKCELLEHLIFKEAGYDLNVVLTAWLLRPR